MTTEHCGTPLNNLFFSIYPNSCIELDERRTVELAFGGTVGGGVGEVMAVLWMSLERKDIAPSPCSRDDLRKAVGLNSLRVGS